MIRKVPNWHREVDEEIRHVRGLVLIRSLLAERGASARELAECDAVIDACRHRLARVALREAA